jgi:hypothetical protein
LIELRAGTEPGMQLPVRATIWPSCEKLISLAPILAATRSSATRTGTEYWSAGHC